MPPFHLPNKLTLWVNSITFSDIFNVLLRRSVTYTDERRLAMKSLVASKYDNNNSAQGRANNDKLCSGCKQYMSTRGQAIQTCEQSTPTWTQCKTSKDNWSMSLFCAGIIDTATGKRSGRTMSVQGYALLGPIVYPNEEIKVLGAHDGWNTCTRRFNFCFPNYKDTYGAFYG